MRKIGALAVVLTLVLVMSVATPALAVTKGGTRIQDGLLTYPYGYLQGQPIKVDYDAYGTNFQAHTFCGSYANIFFYHWGLPPYGGDDEAYVAANPIVIENPYLNTYVWPYRDVLLIIKWNDAWLSNMDRDGDGLLDGWYLDESRVGSGAWQTTHMKGSYIGDDGKKHSWEYFEKLVAVPGDAIKVDGTWYTAGGTEIGPSVFDWFAITQVVNNDPYSGYHGIEYLSPASVGLGYYAP